MKLKKIAYKEVLTDIYPLEILIKKLENELIFLTARDIYVDSQKIRFGRFSVKTTINSLSCIVGGYIDFIQKESTISIILTCYYDVTIETIVLLAGIILAIYNVNIEFIIISLIGVFQLIVKIFMASIASRKIIESSPVLTDI